MPTVEDRLASLELDVKRCKRSARNARFVAAGCLLGAVALAAAPAVTETLRARRIEIVDADGKVVAKLSSAASGGQIDLWSAGGTNVLRASANLHGGDLAMWNAKGQNVFGAFATAAGGEAAVYDKTGTAAASMSSAVSGGKVVVSDTSGDASVIVSTNEAGGRFEILNATGGPLVRAGALSPSGTTAAPAQLEMFNLLGNRYAAATATEAGGDFTISNNAGTPMVRLFAETGGGNVDVINSNAQLAASLGVVNDVGALLIRNGADEEVAFLGGSTTQDGTLQLSDRDGTVFAAATRGPTGGGAISLHSDGKQSVELAALSGNGGVGRLTLFDDQSASAVSLESKKGGGGSISLRTGTTLSLALGAIANGGLLNLMNEAGQVVVAAGNAVDGDGGSVTIKNGANVPVLRAGSSAEGSGELSVYSQDGLKKRVTAP